MGFGRYVTRRLCYMFILILLIICFNFVLFQVVPFLTSCPGRTYTQCAAALYLPPAPAHGTPPDEAAIMKKERLDILALYGFNQSLSTRFVLYVRNMFTFQFGYNVGSLETGLVARTIGIRLPYTVLLIATSTIAAFLIGIGLGVVAAAKRGKVLDVSSLAGLLFVNSLPVFFLGAILELVQLGALGSFYKPIGPLTLAKTGLAFDVGVLQAFFLPFLTLTLAGIGGVFLIQRATMIDTVAEDYVLMARAKGVPERAVLFKHSLRNAVLPIVTAFAISMGGILSGAVITETVFSWPGLGLAIYQGILSLDFPLEQAIFFVISLMILVAVFIADLVYGVLDPRVSVR
ncbi:MAG TPA: ABC transporter permease [Nitrososphaerales archaeon]|nr:ABC transporter permease [Nitrososphaerales archaeon]